MIVACSLPSEVLFELFALHSHAMTHQEQPVFCEEKDEGERQQAAGESDDKIVTHRSMCSDCIST